MPHGFDLPFSIRDAIADPPVVAVVDAGAIDTGSDPVWKALAAAGLARIVGFEPIVAACDKLNADAPDGAYFLPTALGDGEVRTLRIARHAPFSSLYSVNQAFVDLFDGLAALMATVDSEHVATRRLDDVEALQDSGCDFLKVSVQGSEYETLINAPKTLEQALVVQTTACLAPVYVDSPGIGPIDTLLRAAGFIVHQYLGSGGRALAWPDGVRPGATPPLNQHLWSDVVYVKDFTHADRQSAERWIRLAVIVHVTYGAWDLAHLALCHADRLTGSTLGPRYLAAGNEALLRTRGQALPADAARSKPGWLSRLLSRA